MRVIFRGIWSSREARGGRGGRPCPAGIRREKNPGNGGSGDTGTPRAPIFRPDPNSPAMSMHIAVVGTGYVGLVTGTCFADTGFRVTCVDIDEEKVRTLSSGTATIFEAGLEPLLKRSEHRA